MTAAVKKVLMTVRSIIGDERSWGKGEDAVNASMKKVGVMHGNACKWCLSGAIQRALILYGKGYPDEVAVRKQIITVLEKRHYKPNVVQFNDSPSTTYKDVMEVLDEAIDTA